MKWIGITGSWRNTNSQIEQDVRYVVDQIIKRGDGIVTGGALGVDYIATDEALKLNPTATQIKIFLPSSLEIYAAHYRKRAKEGVITEKQAEDLMAQLTAIKKANKEALIEGRFDVINNATYFERNTWVVDASDALQAFHVNGSEGVQDTVDKALKQGKPVEKLTYDLRDESDSAAEIYDKISGAYASRFSAPSDHIDDFLRKVRKGGRILDVGCGPGTDATYMSSKGFDATGIDLSEKMIDLAKRKAPKAHFEKADMRRLDFEPGTFDGILVSFSLIHVPKRYIPKVIRDFYKLLKPDGIICLGIQEGKSEEKLVAEPLKPDEKVFINVMSADEIRELLRETGFTVLDEFSRPPENKAELNFNKFVVIAKKI